MRLYLFRLSLSQRKIQGDLFDDPVSPELENQSRYDFLMRFFANDEFYYSPRTNVELLYKPVQIDDSVVASIVAKKRDLSGRFSDENPFEIEQIHQWEISNIYFNFGDDEQVVGVELNRNIAQNPYTIIKDLVEYINSLSEYRRYEIHAKPVVVTQSFWQAVREHDGHITNFSFEIVAPNPVPDVKNNTEEAFKTLEILRGQKLKQSVSSKDGLNLDNDVVREKVQRAEAGEASVIAKSGSKTVYDSDNENSAKTEEVSDDLSASTSKKDGLFARLSVILKR